jgi:threonine/homoserine/homoserine lactone efflux protein
MITPDFLATVVLVSISGVLGPGPLFVASIMRATRTGWLGGFESAVGHTVVEFPLVIGLSLGLSSFLLGSVRIIALVGGLALIIFGCAQLIQARKAIGLAKQPSTRTWDKRNGILVGLVLTAFNPFFLIWWATVGSLLIAQALLLGAFGGVLIMFAAHIWMDYAWLTGTAKLASHGGFLLGKWYRILLLLFGVAMLYFGATFVISSFA